MRLKEIYQIALNSNSSYLLHFFKNQFFKLKFQPAPDLLYMYLSNGQNFSLMTMDDSLNDLL